MQAAEAKKVYAVAYHSDMAKYGPHAHLTAVTHQWGALLHQGGAGCDQRHVEARQRLGRNQGGHDQNGPVQHGSAAGRSRISWNKTAADIGAGKFHPFTGPVRDSDGKERLAAGQVMSDDVLSKMDYYVEGVQGKLPK